MPLEVRKYVTATGRVPFDEWIATLSSVMRARAYANIARVEAGNLGNVKPLTDTDGVMELRMFFGPGYRVYLGRDGATIMLLLCGGDKNSQRRDIVRAMAMWRDYKTRKESENGAVS